MRVPVDSAPATVESLGRQLKEALALRRLQSISVWDAEGSVQWLNEGALGPDEHAVVLEGFEHLRNNRSLTCHETGLEDGRYALFLPVRTPSGVAVGLVLVLADVKSMGEGAQERIATPTVRAIMQRFAVLMKPAGLTTSSMPALAVLELADPSEPTAAAAPAMANPLALVDASASGISPQAVHDLLEFELTPEELKLEAVPAAPVQEAPLRLSEGAAPEVTQEVSLLEFIPAPPVLSAAPAPLRSAPAVIPAAARSAPANVDASARISAAVQRARTVQPPTPAITPSPVEQPAAASVTATSDSHLLLEVLQFGKLRAGGQSRRFQVQARTPGTDALILQRLVTWLAAHRSGWSSQPTSFTVNLSIATLED